MHLARFAVFSLLSVILSTSEVTTSLISTMLQYTKQHSSNPYWYSVHIPSAVTWFTGHWRGTGVIQVKMSYLERQFILMVKYSDGHAVFRKV